MNLKHITISRRSALLSVIFLILSIVVFLYVLFKNTEQENRRDYTTRMMVISKDLTIDISDTLTSIQSGYEGIGECHANSLNITGEVKDAISWIYIKDKNKGDCKYFVNPRNESGKEDEIVINNISYDGVIVTMSINQNIIKEKYFYQGDDVALYSPGKKEKYVDIVLLDNFPILIGYSYKTTISNFIFEEKIKISFVIVILLITSILIYKILAKDRGMLGDLIRGLENDEFIPFYQPIIDVTNNSIYGAEVLVRWIHPTDGLMPPNVFIPLAERSGIVGDISRSLFKKIVHDLNKIKAEYDGRLYISMNIGPEIEFSSAFYNDCNIYIDEMNKLIEHVCFEITERENIEENEGCKNFIAWLANKNATLALDDFGTGNSNMAYISLIEPQYLKIDRLFVSGIGENKTLESLIESTINLARLLDIEVIAEGVETNQQLDFLKEKGVRLIQGFLFSKPLPASDFRVFIIKQQSSQLAMGE